MRLAPSGAGPNSVGYSVLIPPNYYYNSSRSLLSVIFRTIRRTAEPVKLSRLLTAWSDEPLEDLSCMLGSGARGERWRWLLVGQCRQ